MWLLLGVLDKMDKILSLSLLCIVPVQYSMIDCSLTRSGNITTTAGWEDKVRTSLGGESEFKQYAVLRVLGEVSFKFHE